MSSQTIKDLVAKSVPKKLLPLVPRSYDLIGSIAIVEIKPELKKYEKKIAQAILAIHKPIKTIAKKKSAMAGKYRVRKVQILAGEKTTETTYRESNCLMKLDVEKVYFSVRLSHERERIASLVKENENVLVMFAGVGPFALVIAKKHKHANIAGIELNPTAAKYFKENIKLNKLTNCVSYKGSVKTVIPKHFTNWADRIVMPLPKDADKFLPSAFLAAKDGAVIHMYHFGNRETVFEDLKEKINDMADKMYPTYSIQFLSQKVVRPYAPDIIQVCIDFRIRF